MSRVNPIIGFFSCLAAAWIITYLVGIPGTFAQYILEDFIMWGENPVLVFMNAVCDVQATAYLLMTFGRFGAIAALGVGGLVAGLVSRRISSAIVVSTAYLAFVFICAYLTGFAIGIHPLILTEFFFGVFDTVTMSIVISIPVIAISVVVSFLVLSIPAAIGARITMKREEEIENDMP
ncbi:MAG: hypothetical protein ACFE7E_04315 [Candidatus Hodarchaeota archaeon]